MNPFGAAHGLPPKPVVDANHPLAPQAGITKPDSIPQKRNAEGSIAINSLPAPGHATLKLRGILKQPAENVLDARRLTPDEIFDLLESPELGNTAENVEMSKTLCWDDGVAMSPLVPERVKLVLFVSVGRGFCLTICRSGYERIMHIVLYMGNEPVNFTFHEHLLLRMSGLLRGTRSAGRHPGSSLDNPFVLEPQEYLSHIKPRIIHLLVHWLYYNKFTDSEHINFNELLSLYFLGNYYAITVVKNVVIDHLIDKSLQFHIPTKCTKRVYRSTSDGDQLRELWADFYVWGEINETQFQDELDGGRVDPQFLQDLAVRQMSRLNRVQGTEPDIPPYERDSALYHRRVEGQCCCRAQFEGSQYSHRGDYIRATRSLEDRLRGAQAHIKELERKTAKLRKTLQMQKDVTGRDRMLSNDDSKRPARWVDSLESGTKRRKLVDRLQDGLEEGLVLGQISELRRAGGA